MVSLTVSTPGKPTINLDFPSKHPDGVTVRDLKSAVHAKFPKLVPNRQRLTVPSGGSKPTPLTDDDKPISSYGVGEGAQLRLKDLGRQVGYRYLYLWEYAGPIFLNPLALELSQYIWGRYPVSALQRTVRNYIVLHFLKRFLESAFVHSFSRSTLPLTYVVRNSLYYWGVCGGLISLTVFRPAYSAFALKGTLLDDPRWLTFWSVFIFVCEALNLYAHVHLASLRVPKGQPRKYPTALGFGIAVCANYMYETWGIIGLLIMTAGDIGVIVYLAIAVSFMGLWAGQKRARYKREMDPKVFPGKRWKMFPPIF